MALGAEGCQMQGRQRTFLVLSFSVPTSCGVGVSVSVSGGQMMIRPCQVNAWWRYHYLSTTIHSRGQPKQVWKGYVLSSRRLPACT
ncbi:hypothetical protein COCSADRAFT_207844 [Bipolaris sorokiniana ND90Pr]|uniref:Uncharacterized protein n=1 Tax=Cochliobolus sativus (strain ND90Pr / ATCC 201652) TaxID=665912 RepID=M2TKM0_COCSN|nr:uncharacterized protein COCSADRAFT_207844 [Bipolaris sorokiniana ND90Pr]EMD69242.1 hypothetical protein COCSADRAFT_207844 [Bipolaris sorokiniana ND90Pr]